MRCRPAVLVCLLIALQSTSAAAVLCARKRPDGTFNSNVALRETCRPRETQLDPVALGLQGPKGDQGNPGTGVSVIDANGARVGTVVDVYRTERDIGESNTPLGQVSLLREVGSRPVLFRVSSLGFEHTLADRLTFSELGCVGDASFELDDVSAPPVVDVALAVFGSTAYVSTGATVLGLDGPSQLRFNYSPANCAQDAGTFVPPNACCLNVHDGGAGNVRAVAVDVSSFGLHPPFHLGALP